MEIMEIVPKNLEQGAMIDYIKDQFFIFLKDDAWSAHEIQALKRNKLHLFFVVKDEIIEFLMQVNDAIETCDFPFVANEDCPKSLLNPEEGYHFTILLIDKDQNIVANKKVTLNKKDSQIIAKTILETKPIDEEQYNRKLEHLQKNFEPFELEEFALIHAIF